MKRQCSGTDRSLERAIQKKDINALLQGSIYTRCSLTLHVRRWSIRFGFDLLPLLFISERHIRLRRSGICRLGVCRAIGSIRDVRFVWCLTSGVGVSGVVCLRVPVYQIPEEGVNNSQARHLGQEPQFLTQSPNYEHKEDIQNGEQKRGQRFREERNIILRISEQM